MSGVFISYSSKEHNSAARYFIGLTREKLEKSGIKNVWIDKFSIRADSPWREEIDKGISGSHVVIVILNKESAESSYVTYEWAYALGREILVIPVKIEDCKIHPRLSAMQYIDFSGDKEPWDELIKCVNDEFAKKSTKQMQTDEINTQKIRLDNYRNALNKRNAELDIRENELNDKIKRVNNRFAENSAKQIIKTDEINTQKIWLEEYSNELNKRNEELDRRENELNNEKMEMKKMMSELPITIKGVQYPANTKKLDLRAYEGEWRLWNNDINDLSRFTCLEELNLDGNNINDLNFISKLTKLKILYLNDNGITNITELRNLSNLVAVSIAENKFDDISPLSTLYNLKALYLSNLQSADIRSLSGLINLKSLMLFQCEIDNLIPLTNLRKLEYLDLGLNKLTDLSPLAYLNNLENLKLVGNYNLVDISPLAKLSNLKSVTLNHTSVTDWSPVSHVPTVEGRPD